MGGYSIKLCSERFRPEVQSLTLRDCAIIIRGGGETRGGALHKIAAKIGGAQSKITHGGGGLSFIRHVDKIKRNKRFSIQA